MKAMHRRTLLATVGTIAFAKNAWAQRSRRTVRVGWLAGTHMAPKDDPYLAAFVSGMRQLGYVEGRNLVVELRYLSYDQVAGVKSIDDYYALLEAATEDLAQVPVDVIVARHTITAEGARRATRTVPIVMGAAANPIAVGVIESLSRPGGNVTGLTLDTADVTAKRLQLLSEIMPDKRTIGLVYGVASKAYPVTAEWLKACDEAASALGLAFETVDLTVRNFPLWDSILSRAAAGGLQALYLSEVPYYLQRQARLGEIAVKNGLAIMGFAPEFARSGCLVAYGVEVGELFRRAAVFVDKIVNGASPATLPVEQPTKFTLVVNQKVAAALRLTIPGSILTLADEIVD